MDVSGAAPLAAVPVPGEPEVLTPEQIAEQKAERNKLLMLAGFGALVLATLAYIATTLIAGVTKEVAKKPPEHGGVLGAMLFNQTRMRMMLLAEAVSRNHDATGEVTLDLRKLTRHGGTASMMTDYWGNNFFLRESRITSAGLDGKQDTKDDFWLDPVLMEMGGWEPDAEQIAESMRGLPGGQAAYEQMKLIQSQRERANRMIEQVEQTQIEAELGPTILMPEGASEAPVVGRSSPRGGEDPMKFVPERESDDPAPTPGP